jgi:hypothetical protein
MKKSLAEIEFETFHDVWIDVRYKGPPLTPDGHENKHAVYRKSSEVSIGGWRDRSISDLRKYRKPTEAEVKILAKVEYQRLLSEYSEGDHGSNPNEEVKRQMLREAGQRGGQKSKENKPILEAAKKYLQDPTQKLSEKTNEGIAKKFRNEYKENKPMTITIDNAKWEVFCQGEIISSRSGERYDGRKAKNEEKSITYSTFWKTYIPKAKKLIYPSES